MSSICFVLLFVLLVPVLAAHAEDVPLPAAAWMAEMAIEARLSPDGSTLALTTRRVLADRSAPLVPGYSNGFQPTLHIITPHGERVLAGGFRPRWSPSGETLATEVLAPQSYDLVLWDVHDGFRHVVSVPRYKWSDPPRFSWINENQLVVTTWNKRPDEPVTKADSIGIVSVPNLMRLEVIDVHSLHRRVLADGFYAGLETGARYVAAVNVLSYEYRKLKPDYVDFDDTTSEVDIIDTTSGTLSRVPLPRLDSDSLQWSADGRRLRVISAGKSRIVDTGAGSPRLLARTFDAVAFAGSMTAIRTGSEWRDLDRDSALPGQPVMGMDHLFFLTPDGLQDASRHTVLPDAVSIGRAGAGIYLSGKVHPPQYDSHGAHNATPRWILDAAGQPENLPADVKLLDVSPHGVCWWEHEQIVRVRGWSHPALALNSFLSGFNWGEYHTYPVGQDHRDFLVLPPGHTSGPLPTVIWMYPGGAMDDWAAPNLNHLEFAAAILARAGYAVYYPYMALGPADRLGNFRDDIVSSFREARERALATGFVDPERIAIQGQSFGSDAVMSLACEPGIRAGIGLSGQADFTSFFLQVQKRDQLFNGASYILDLTWKTWLLENEQFRMGSLPWEEVERYRNNSAIFHAREACVPLLLVCTDGDGFYPFTEEFFEALTRLQKPARLLRYRDEIHDIARAPNVRDFWEEELAWLHRYMK